MTVNWLLEVGFLILVLFCLPLVYLDWGFIRRGRNVPHAPKRNEYEEYLAAQRRKSRDVRIATMTADDTRLPDPPREHQTYKRIAH